jgi:hypothetical protein
MDHSWDGDTLTLVITKADIPVDKDIIDAVWDYAGSGEKEGATIARFMVLCIAILFKGVLQFL